MMCVTYCTIWNLPYKILGMPLGLVIDCWDFMAIPSPHSYPDKKILKCLLCLKWFHYPLELFFASPQQSFCGNRFIMIFIAIITIIIITIIIIIIIIIIIYYYYYYYHFNRKAVIYCAVMAFLCKLSSSS